ncbi:MAG TPA: MerR family transcriptional regulator, partial [Pseudobdellovibrionaceae bacterium]|nr:MerR family transcriptional regulator [Pseudobdellovibrionaceae bacterium]
MDCDFDELHAEMGRKEVGVAMHPRAGFHRLCFMLQRLTSFDPIDLVVTSNPMVNSMGRNSSMLSVGQFAKLAKVSARTVRYYESIGLLQAVKRGENNYRYYDKKWLEQIVRIRGLQELGFSLEEIQAIVRFSQDELHARLKEKLEALGDDIAELEVRREKIRQLLSVSKKIESGEWITTTEKELFMESIRQEVIQGLRAKYPSMSEATLAYLDRDIWLTSHPNTIDFIKAVQKCLEFAKRKNLILGTARGSAPASLSLFGLGISGVDPLSHQMIPERLSTQCPFFHIDVEYERGQEFVDYCKEMNKSLAYGEIQAFKMPLIDIVKSTHDKIGKILDYESIDDDAECV